MTIDLIERAQQVRREMFVPGRRDMGVLDHVCFMLGVNLSEAKKIQALMNQELAGAMNEKQMVARAFVLGIELGIAAERKVREAVE